MSILGNKKQIQPKWPLRIGDLHGPYESVENALESIKQDFLFLIKTIPGEWPMNPDLGIGLERYLFENYLSPELSEIKTKIDIQLKKYLPVIELVDAKFISSDENIDRSITVLRIEYFIPDLEKMETLETKLYMGEQK